MSNYSDTFKMIFVAVLIIFMIYIFQSCDIPKSNNKYTEEYVSYLPKNATNITDMGNGWIKFDLIIERKSRTFLFYKSTLVDNVMCAITEITE